jgi:hypothetical protein
VLHEQRNIQDSAQLTWQTVVDISGVDAEKQSTARELVMQVLNHGLIGVGKTKANIRVKAVQAPMSKKIAFEGNDKNMVYLTLQTPALLTPNICGSGEDALFQAYSSYFAVASSHTLALQHFYASQVLRGGNYQKTRFKGKANSPPAYKPWLLTEAGAVFVLKVNDTNAVKEKLAQWLKTGLPSVAGHENWETNPYQPANGFGEIALNYPEHSEWHPTKLKLNVTKLAPAITITATTTATADSTTNHPLGATA